MRVEGMETAGPRTPVIGILANCKEWMGFDTTLVHRKYADPVEAAGGAVASLLPSEDAAYTDALLSRLDGLLLTGAATCIDPSLYGRPVTFETDRDPRRDATALHAVRRAIEWDLPVLGICRGMQEIVVATGGTLHQNLAEDIDSDIRHILPRDMGMARYAPAHDIEIAPGGLIADLWTERRVKVNSVHHQGADRLGDGVRVEATAPDGLVEAVSLPGPSFVLGVEWHLEHDIHAEPFNRRIMAAFVEAAASRAARR